MIVAAGILKLLFVLSFILSGVYMITTGSIASCGGILTWVLLSLLVWMILSVAFSPIILLFALIGIVFKF